MALRLIYWLFSPLHPAQGQALGSGREEGLSAKIIQPQAMRCSLCTH